MKNNIIKFYHWKYAKYLVFFSFFSILILFYLLRFIDPTNILIKWVIGYFDPNYVYYQKRMDFSFVLIFWIILVLVCTFLIKLLYDKNRKNQIFLLILFIFSLLIVIGPSLANNRLWSSDSLYHLNVVKLIIEKRNLLEYLTKTDINNYQNFFYHHFYARLSILTGLDPHFVFLYIAPFIQFLIFFIGIYLVLNKCFTEKETKENEKIKIIIFAVLIFLSLNLSTSLTMTPMGFVIGFMPLVLYLCYKFSIVNFIPLIIINFVAIQSHIYGYLIVVFSLIALSLRLFYLINKRTHLIRKITYSHVLIFNGVIYVLLLLIIIFPTIVTTFISFLPISESIKEYIIINWNTGGTFIRARFQESLYRTLTKVIIFSIIFFVIIFNQFRYVSKFKKKVKFEWDFKSYLLLFLDVVSLFVILSLFYGADILFFRVIRFLMPFYLLLFLTNCWIIINESRYNFESRSFKFNYFINKKSTQIFLILTLFLLSLTTYETRTSFTEEQYEAVYWIKNNLPEESRFVTSESLVELIFGLSMMRTTSYMNKFFYDFDNDVIKIYDYPESRLFIFIDTDPPHTFSKLPIFHGDLLSSNYSKNFDLFLQKLNESSYYSLIYEENNILVYEILREASLF